MAKGICTVSGRPCRCESGEGCTKPRLGPRADPSSGRNLQWARTAIMRLRYAAEALDLAVDELVYERPLPAPEWRDKVRRINRLIDELEEETSL